MAKAKSSSPGKAPSRAQSSPPLRRSPRKTVKSAKILEAEATAATTKVRKRKSPTKKTGLHSPLVASRKSPSKPASTTSPGRREGETPRPRGRPRKPSRATAANPPSSTRKQKRSIADQNVILAPANNEDWTDSPGKKKSPDRRTSRTSTSASSTGGDELEINENNRTRLRQSSVGGIRKSIEVASRVSAKSKTPSKGARRGKSQSPAKEPAATTSERRPSALRRYPSRSTRARSRSPVKVTFQDQLPEDANTGRRSRSRSSEATKESKKSPAKVSQSSKGDRSEGSREEITIAPRRSPDISTFLTPVDKPGTRRKTPTSEQVNRHKARETAFLGNFAELKSLRRVESNAYKSRKHGVELDGYSHLAYSRFDPGDERRAEERGARRAELEIALHEVADNREQRLREGYDKRIVSLPTGVAGRVPVVSEEVRKEARQQLSHLGSQQELLQMGRPRANIGANRQTNANVERNQAQALPETSKPNSFFSRATSTVRSTFSALGQSIWGSTPPTTDREVETGPETLPRARGRSQGVSEGRKRKASAPELGRPAKRTRR